MQALGKPALPWDHCRSPRSDSGWSLQILQRDLERLYAEETGCAPEPLPALTVTPAEHAEAQRARFADGVPRAQRRFWAAELRELERTELPTDRPPSEAEPWRAD